MAGTVYLLHANEPLPSDTRSYRRGASHYLGWSKDADPSARIADHRAGRGAKITAEFARRGIALELVRTWPGGRKLERQLKAWKKAAQLCPICRAAMLARKAARQRKRRRAMSLVGAA